jgi:hypothetical protein
MAVINAVERRCQVGVKDPQPLGIDALCGQEDSLDRIMTATARPKTIGLRLEPSFPLRFQCADRQGLQHPVSDNGDGDFILPLLQSRVGIFSLVRCRAG